MEAFSACSLWNQCCEVMKCIHSGTDQIPAVEWERACTTANKYKNGINYFKPTKAIESADMPIILIVDGNSIIHKAFYCTPMLRAPDGRPTNGVYGALRTLVAAVMARKPTHIVVAMDWPAKTFRHQIFPEYKANRKKSPEDLTLQLPLAREAMQKLKIPYVEVKGYEADDVIGTIAKKAFDDNFRVEILTSDKDCLQLINERTTVLLHKGKFEECTPHTTPLIAGFFHYQTIDMKSLAGDPSDNVPGVPRVGKKTAVTLLEKYGSVEEVINKADEIPGKVGDNIRNNIDKIHLSRELVTIEKNVSLKISLDSLTIPFGDQKQMQFAKNYLESLGIKVVKLDAFYTQTKTEQPKNFSPLSRYDSQNLKVEIEFNGKANMCGICISLYECNRFVELKNGKLFFGARIFYACQKCEGMLSTEAYRRI